MKLSNRRGVSPIVSTLLIMVITMIALSITLGYTQTTLTRKNGETDFESAKSFMRTLGLQVDDVAWVKGRVDTVHFTAQYGQIEYLSDVIRYHVILKDWLGQPITTEPIFFDCDILMYNIPTTKYYLEENDPVQLLGGEEGELIFDGVDAPVTKVIWVHKANVGDADFLRVVLIPAIRMQSYSVDTGGPTPTQYVRLYIPDLTAGYSSNLAKSVVLTGSGVNVDKYESVSAIEVSVEFLRVDANYDNNFFDFPAGQNITLNQPSSVEIYQGTAKLDYGA